MPCTFPSPEIERAIAFHGHNCPGLTIGIRASELALKELGALSGGDLVTVVETDMCGVDAIQFFTGCTMGKGNLIHLDYGKMAFSFYDRRSGRGFRALLKPEGQSSMVDEMAGLMAKIAAGTASSDEQERIKVLRQQSIDHFLGIDLDEMFSVEWLDALPPRPPRVLASLSCEVCGEKTMESRTRRFAGKTMCIPCFNKVEQKI